MMKEIEEIVEHDLDFLPLKSYANITEAHVHYVIVRFLCNML